VDEEYLETKRNDQNGMLLKKEKQLLEFRKVLDELGDENKSVNMTDTDAAVMQHKDKRKLPSYNHQSAVVGKYGVTCAVGIRYENDQPKDLFELVDEARKSTPLRSISERPVGAVLCVVRVHLERSEELISTVGNRIKKE
jgi:hypothetical protein